MVVDTGAPTILEAVKRYWGYDSLRPLQQEAIRAGLDHRDSLVVMPTGGGKSLCYQVPPLIAGRCAVVVSPLISLMKDQVDGLRLAGYPAAAINSTMSADDARAAEQAALNGELLLLYVAPERLLTSQFLGFLRQLKVDSFAIDEAHCISHWGHDFRPEYRRLVELRRHFPEASLHAFTATATPRVRDDIVAQLALREPAILIGTFDRPNLTYRIVPRRSSEELERIVARHAGAAVIIYCISRKDTESTAALLTARGIQAKAYHAGLSPNVRRRVQDEFSSERLNVVVATVAFGMGIDRSNVRCVIHANMPKTVEAYQQETGRTGRDSLPAECVLLYSPADAVRWKQLMARSTEEAIGQSDDHDAIAALKEAMQVQFGLLAHMERLCSGARCRHRVLSEYFGQRLETPNCGACDVCLGELPTLPDSTEVARKILSCVYRVYQHSGSAFGPPHLADILIGKATERVKQRGHEILSTFGQLKGHPRDAVIAYIQQLADQGILAQSADQYRTVELTQEARAVLKNERQVTLVGPSAPTDRAPRTVAADSSPLDAAGEALFQELRELRRRLAQDAGVPPYVVFGDDTLKELARVRPATRETLINVRGVGQKKLASFGETILDAVRAFCAGRQIPTDVATGSRASSRMSDDPERPLSAARRRAFELFESRTSLDQVRALMGMTEQTAVQYLVEFIERRAPADLAPWVEGAVYSAVVRARSEAGSDRPARVFEHLRGTVTYETVRLVMAHGRAPAPTQDLVKAHSPAVALAFERFAQGRSVESVCAELVRKPSTVYGYLGRYIAGHKPASIDAWVNPMTYSLVISTAKALGTPMLTPIKEKLGDGVTWEAIRLSLTHHQALEGPIAVPAPAPPAPTAGGVPS